MAATVVGMGRPKKNTASTSGKHKTPRNMVNIRQQFLDPLEVLKVRLGFENMTELVNQLVREGLERNQLWPVKRPQGS